ncbi:MAG TPA: hypothetical protein DEO56_09945, partial [Nitrosomonas nitrosa]|nr:hypothetical protein [Nitrosomonas nitrosa]
MTDTKHLIPFVGLRPFDIADHRWFHGRDREIATLLRKVRNNRFAAVVGASGSGKSSLVRAGILVPLADDGWQSIVAKPGSAPITKLAAALSAAAHQYVSSDEDADNLAAARVYRYEALLRQSAYGLAKICQQLIPDAPRLILVIDQFEELFRYGEGAQGAEKAAMEEESRAFVELLLTATSQTTGRLHIVLTMRSDFFGNCAAYTGLAEAVSDSQYLVPLPRRDQMEAIIRKPIDEAGGRVDEMLVQRLLLEMVDQMDHLPALQHTLRRLWEMAQTAAGSRSLREEDYQIIGGIAGSIDFKAEQMATEIRKAHAEDSITLELVMKAITDLDEQGRATRRPQKRGALLELVAEVMDDKQAAEASLNRVLKTLVNEEVSFIQLGSGDDAEVDIGHEALIRSWRRLCGKDRQFKTGWLMEEREDGRHWWDLARRKKNEQNLHLTDAWQTRQWIKKNKIGPVWTSRYGDAWQAIDQFVGKSLLRNGAISASILTAITVILAVSIGFAWINYNAAQKNYQEMIQQESETLRQARAGALAAAGYARSLIDEGQTRLGALIALSVVPESRRKDDPRYVDEVGAVLDRALTRSIEIMRFHQLDWVYSVAFSPDGNRILSGGKDGALRMWDVQTGKQIGKPLIGHEASILSVAFSSDGRRIVSGSLDNTLRLWDAQTGMPIREPLTGHVHDVLSVAFSPDGRRIVSGSRDNTLRLWDAQTGMPIGEPLTGHGDSVYSVAFSPDGRRIVSGSRDNTLRLWEAQPTVVLIGEPLAGHGDRVNSVAFSPDSRRIVSG